MADIKGGHPDEVDLTPEEMAAIVKLQKVFKNFPKSLMIHADLGQLNVMRKDAEGKMSEVDTAEYIITTIQGVFAEGGGL